MRCCKEFSFSTEIPLIILDNYNAIFKPQSISSTAIENSFPGA